MTGRAAIADLGADADQEAGGGDPERGRDIPTRWRGRQCRRGAARASDAEAGKHEGRAPRAEHERNKEDEAPDHGLCRGEHLAENAGDAGNASCAEPQDGGCKADECAAGNGGQGSKVFHAVTSNRVEPGT